jgi:hypothetical protein
MVMWCTISEMQQPSAGTFNNHCPSSGQFHQPSFSLFSHPLLYCFFEHGKSVKQLIFHIAMLCSANPHVFKNIAPLQSLLFSKIHIF